MCGRDGFFPALNPSLVDQRERDQSVRAPSRVVHLRDPRSSACRWAVSPARGRPNV